MTIQQALTNIMSAVYGKDVRESIHDGIELCYNERASGGLNPQTDANLFYSGIAYFSSTATNRPFSADFLLIAGGNATSCCQIAFAVANAYAPKIRRRANGTWTEWTALTLS